MQLSPSASLSHMVKHYLLLEYEKDIRLNYRLFSDGNPGIVFHFKNPLIQYNGNQLNGCIQPNSFIYGQITHYNDVTSNGKLGMLVVVLQPYAIYSLLHIPAYELNNCIIKLADLFGQEALDLEDQILDSQKIHHVIESVEKFLLKKITYRNEPDQLFKESLHVICQYRGAITIEELLKKVYVTEKQLERKFREYIGTTPKKYSDIIKFQNFLKQLQGQSPDKKITDVVYDNGYYDQSHLNNYFKKVTGITPLQYKRDRPLLAINFMQLSENT